MSGDLLRTSLHSHLTARALSTETVIEVEYVPAVLPPRPTSVYNHDDWIASICQIDISLTKLNRRKGGRGESNGFTDGDKPISKRVQSCLATGSYDGCVKIWLDGVNLCTQEAHEGPVKAVVRIPGTSCLLTVGEDCFARLWKWRQVGSYGGKSRQSTGSAKTQQKSAALEPLRVLSGHLEAIETASCRSDGRRCATGGWDKNIHLWNSSVALESSDSVLAMKDSSEVKERSRKRRKHEGHDAEDALLPPSTCEEDEPLHTLQGHTQCVSSLLWTSGDTILSSSWDHTIRAWDADVGASTETFVHSKAIHCMAAPALEASMPKLIAFGGSENLVRIWDRREASHNRSSATVGDALDASARAVRSLSSHSGWVTALAWHPTSEHHVLSASRDGSSKLWDIRSTVPLATLHGEPENLLACAWVDDGRGIAFGGTASMLHLAEVDI